MQTEFHIVLLLPLNAHQLSLLHADYISTLGSGCPFIDSVSRSDVLNHTLQTAVLLNFAHKHNFLFKQQPFSQGATEMPNIIFYL